jgi:hypothetical protein
LPIVGLIVRITYESLVHAVTMNTMISQGMTQAIEEIAVRKGKSVDTMIPTW